MLPSEANMLYTWQRHHMRAWIGRPLFIVACCHVPLVGIIMILEIWHQIRLLRQAPLLQDHTQLHIVDAVVDASAFVRATPTGLIVMYSVSSDCDAAIGAGATRLA